MFPSCIICLLLCNSDTPSMNRNTYAKDTKQGRPTYNTEIIHDECFRVDGFGTRGHDLATIDNCRNSLILIVQKQCASTLHNLHSSEIQRQSQMNLHSFRAYGLRRYHNLPTYLDDPGSRPSQRNHRCHSNSQRTSLGSIPQSANLYRCPKRPYLRCHPKDR